MRQKTFDAVVFADVHSECTRNTNGINIARESLRAGICCTLCAGKFALQHGSPIQFPVLSWGLLIRLPKEITLHYTSGLGLQSKSLTRRPRSSRGPGCRQQGFRLQTVGIRLQTIGIRSQARGMAQGFRLQADAFGSRSCASPQASKKLQSASHPSRRLLRAPGCRQNS